MNSVATLLQPIEAANSDFVVFGYQVRPSPGSRYETARLTATVFFLTYAGSALARIPGSDRAGIALSGAVPMMAE